jgi:hypothetical protein
VCDLEPVGKPSIFKLFRSTADLVRMLSTLDLNCEENVARTVEGEFVYYTTIKREQNKRLIYECRCDERLKAKSERSTHLAYTVI